MVRAPTSRNDASEHFRKHAKANIEKYRKYRVAELALTWPNTGYRTGSKAQRVLD
jgi:hypothetical protein